MRAAFPERTIARETPLIALWWDERPSPRPGKRRREGERWSADGIGQGLRGWFGRNGKPVKRSKPKPARRPPGRPHSGRRESVIERQARQQEFHDGEF